MPGWWLSDLGNCIASPGPSAFQVADQVAGAEAEVTSGIHDRQSNKTGTGATNPLDNTQGDLRGYYHAAVGFVHGVLTVAATTTTIAFTGAYEHSDSTGGPWTSIGTDTPSTIVRTDTGGYAFQLENLDLSQAKRYVRFKATPDVSSGAVDTVTLAGTLIVGGAQNNPTDRN